MSLRSCGLRIGYLAPFNLRPKPCGVTGICVTAPGIPMASSMAEAIAAPTPVMPLSPAPLLPRGWRCFRAHPGAAPGAAALPGPLDAERIERARVILAQDDVDLRRLAHRRHQVVRKGG